MVGYLFAGQGSHYVGMGKDLYDTYPVARLVFDRADMTLGFSLSQLCFQGPLAELTKTNNAQPAIFTLSIACWEVFKSVTKNKAIPGDYAAGLSLGEYSALVAAEAMRFEDAVYLVRRRGEFMEEESVKNPGMMLSIIGLDLSHVREICGQTKTEIANLNCPGQVVISGSMVDISRAQKLAQEYGAKMAVLLDVSGAFHSSFMRGAAVKLAAQIAKTNFVQPKIPVVSNVTAKPVNSEEEIRDNLIKQVYSSVLWEDSINFILLQGVRKFFEFGPGNVLKGLMRRINREAEVVNMGKKGDIESVGSAGSK
ncbi:MAG: ACP S-malonyltransferase [Candidatus Omnitrophota bacterium]|nr:ACP S-malonyltransferase [Candidatus Omnitrophota bacterium]